MSERGIMLGVKCPQRYVFWISQNLQLSLILHHATHEAFPALSTGKQSLPA